MAAAATPRRLHRAALLAGAVVAFGGLTLAIGPAAPWVVDHFADGQRVGELGFVHLDGVSGGWLGNLRIAHLKIADGDGVWLRADDASLTWSPQDLLFGRVTLASVHARSLAIARQPALLASQPSSGASIDLHIGALSIDAIKLAAPVFGQAAQFNARLALDLKGGNIEGLDAALLRTDADADHVIASYRPSRAYAMHIDVLGLPSGIIARGLGVADKIVRVTAQGGGDAQNGVAAFDAKIGDEDLIVGQSHWTASSWNAAGRGQLSALPALYELTKRIGPSAAFTASGAQTGAFSAHVQTPFLSGAITGALTDKHELDGGARFVVASQRVSDIAPESPFELGLARVEGELRQARGVTAIHAELTDGVVHAFGQTGHMSGPVQLSFDKDRFQLSGNLRAGPRAAPLFANALAEARLSFDFHRGRFSLDRASYVSTALNLDGGGWVNHGDGEFSGAWQVRDLRAASSLTGGGSGQWRAFAALSPHAQARVWTVTVTGAGANVAGEPNIIPQLTGAAPRIDALFKAERNGIAVDHVRIEGANLRAAAVGHIVHGDSDLSVEASARGPVHIGAAEISGALDATGRITGRLERPTLAVHATLSSFASNGLVVERPVVDLTLAPAGQAYVGQGVAHGVISGQGFQASAAAAVPGTSLALTDLLIHAGSLEARGAATIAAKGVSADLTLAGSLDGLLADAAGRVTGALHLTPQGVTLAARLADARVGGLHAHAATISADGPFNAIAAHYDLQGGVGRAPLTLSGAATLDATHGAADAHVQGEGQLAGEAVSTRTPMHFHWSESGLDASLDVTLADGALAAEWADHRRALSGSVRINDAPLAPLASVIGERATGRIDGHATLNNSGNGLSGGADMSLADARFIGRQRGALNMHVVAALDPGRLHALVNATSSDGLSARLEADAPVVTGDAPIRIALAPSRYGTARWSIHGPAASLWAAARLQDQSLEGGLNGEGALQFGAGSLTGDGHIELSGGRFEDKLTGIVLQNLNARVSVGANGVNIDHFSADDGGGGHMTATGGSSGPQDGRISVAIDNMRVANRPEARARGSGALTLAWHGLHSTLSGNLDLADADIDIATSPEAGIPTMDVVEINEPESENDAGAGAGPQLSVPTSADLDIRVRAPGRIHTRGRGVDAEWSLDLRLAGATGAPLVYGQARAVRGTLALSGQPFDLQDTSLIEFDGDPLDARIDLTAIRETANLTATIHLTGTGRSPEVALTSDPPLPDDEILPQVLFGHSMQDLSPLEAAQLAASLAALSGNASLDILGAARAAVGLDRFNVRQDENGGLLVSGGVYLTRGVYLEVARNGLGQAQTSVEWNVRQHLVLITSFLGNGDQRVSLRWRRESN
jgi:translocation and assembly module TamB